MTEIKASDFELERQVFHLRTLYEVADALNHCRDSEIIYKEVLSILMGTFGAEQGIALASQNDWKVAAQRGFEKEFHLELNAQLLQVKFESKPTEQRKLLLQKFLEKKNSRHLKNGCSIWVEFSGHEQILGGLYLGQRISEETYSETDQELLEAVASHVTTALENLRLYEELKDAEERLHLENIALREEVVREFEDGRIIGQSEGIRTILQQAKSVAKSSTNVLIYGETGTGKELVAKTIHYLGPRRGKPFVTVNCTAIPDNLVESELFGIEAGVATGVKKHIGFFEQAEGGTLFIDEIGDMPVSTQAKILRVVQERNFRRVGGSKEINVDVRIVAATNKNLAEEMKNGNFREDLYFRLSVIELQVPPLRNRRDDIPLLVNHFVKKVKKKLDSKISDFSNNAMKLLTEYDWPGNVRELENEVERAFTLKGEGTLIEPETLSPKVKQSDNGFELPTALTANSLREALDQLERYLIENALEKYRWNKSEVARRLGISRLGLQKKMNRLNIEQQTKSA